MANSSDVPIKKDPIRTIKPKELNIVWGNDTRYWKMHTPDGPEKEEAAELIQVCWLEVTASVKDKQIEKGKSFEIIFEIQMKDDNFGWNGCPVFMMAKAGKKGKYRWEKINLANIATEPNKTKPEIRMSIDVKDDSHENTLYFGLYEVWTGRWKGGLVIYKAEVRPK
ncbi:hypothetical protein P3X46_019980 [Hevea brasiliensis]|uniref:Protein PHLOEM PROTEIN 2-LIKE A9-like n=1 Tax=Hevea brasiliensis TaxID=3981 RepID=A0ABQ9LPJ5_HEVBR|nr:protein PHLOEM PROTEIN 2-LIKE A9 [Hevea brasiliensis]KAJ9168459.1 hypothetical protein P3X46_019980 [Hevea brasiliensis]